MFIKDNLFAINLIDSDHFFWNEGDRNEFTLFVIRAKVIFNRKKYTYYIFQNVATFCVQKKIKIHFFFKQ